MVSWPYQGYREPSWYSGDLRCEADMTSAQTLVLKHGGQTSRRSPLFSTSICVWLFVPVHRNLSWNLEKNEKWQPTEEAYAVYYKEVKDRQTKLSDIWMLNMKMPREWHMTGEKTLRMTSTRHRLLQVHSNDDRVLIRVGVVIQLAQVLRNTHWIMSYKIGPVHRAPYRAVSSAPEFESHRSMRC